MQEMSNKLPDEARVASIVASSVSHPAASLDPAQGFAREQDEAFAAGYGKAAAEMTLGVAALVRKFEQNKARSATGDEISEMVKCAQEDSSTPSRYNGNLRSFEP